MKIIKSSAEYLDSKNEFIDAFIEKVGRTCYKSEDKIEGVSYVNFVKNLIKNKHYAMLEHGIFNVIIDFANGVTQDFIVNNLFGPLNNFIYDVRFINPLCYTTFMPSQEDLDNDREPDGTRVRIAIGFSLRSYIEDFIPIVQNAVEILSRVNKTIEPRDREIQVGAWLIVKIAACVTELFDVYIPSISSLDPNVEVKYPQDIEKIKEIYIASNPENSYEDVFGKLESLITEINVGDQFEVVDDLKIQLLGTSDKRLRDFLSYTIMKFRYHTIKFICDRGVSHELVRHRLASFAQESTRYCAYDHDRFGNEITVIEPRFKDNEELFKLWKESCESCESTYFKLREAGIRPSEARDVLPTSLKTEIVVTANELEWKHILDLRYYGKTGAPAEQMLEVMNYAYKFLAGYSEFIL